MLTYETFAVSRRDRAPLVAWMIEALELAGCRILRDSGADRAPFRLTFETPMGECMGIVAYAFLANSKLTTNRPTDEHRFQIKYGKKDGRLHEIWQDPFELYTTLFVGINLDQGFFVAADPLMHSPTRFFISLEFKDEHARRVLDEGWTSWQREKRTRGLEEPVEVLVGGRQESFLRLVRFEQAARGLDPGHRQLLAEKLFEEAAVRASPAVANQRRIAAETPHDIAKELELSQSEILDLISSAPRLKMAVRGWVAETHLGRILQEVPGVEECAPIQTEGGADLRFRYRGSEPIEIECKNVLRQKMADGTVVLDFQRTRASQADPCSRYYSPRDFDLVAACLHSCTERWEFRYQLTRRMDPHGRCPGKLHHRVRIDDRWSDDIEAVLGAAVGV